MPLRVAPVGELLQNFATEISIAKDQQLTALTLTVGRGPDAAADPEAQAQTGPPPG